MKEKKKSYGKLKAYFAEHDIKHKEVAELLGITQGTFSTKINRNNQDFNIEEVRIICAKYNLDANKFFLI